MNNPIKVMYDEHEIIKKSEKTINDIDCLWEEDASRYIEIVTQLIDFFRNYSDGYHHHKEEGILFPAIKNHPDFVLQEMIDEFETYSLLEYEFEVKLYKKNFFVVILIFDYKKEMVIKK